MVEKPYPWKDGATLLEHTKRKHKILREYFARYLSVRCQLPQQSKFRLAIVEGFAGGGRYICNSPGSPIIFIEELLKATDAFNVKRSAEGMAALDIECFLILNELDTEVLEFLKSNVTPLIAGAKEQQSRLHLQVEYFNNPFQELYSAIKNLLQRGRYQNVLFNLDQCGHSHINVATVMLREERLPISQHHSRRRRFSSRSQSHLFLLSCAKMIQCSLLPNSDFSEQHLPTCRRSRVE